MYMIKKKNLYLAKNCVYGNVYSRHVRFAIRFVLKPELVEDLERVVKLVRRTV